MNLGIVRVLMDLVASPIQDIAATLTTNVVEESSTATAEG